MMDQAERLRQMSRKDEAVHQDDNTKLSRVVTVSSGKGGVGKTSLVVNLALLLAQWNYRVTVVDADLGMANVDVLINAIPKFTLADVINGKKDIQDVILLGPHDVQVIPGGSGFANLANLDRERRERLINRLKVLEAATDVLIIDTGAGISKNVLSFVAAADELFIITTPEPTALTDAYGMIKVVGEEGYKQEANVVVNFLKHIQQGQDIFERLEKVTDRYVSDMHLNYLGGILYDPAVSRAVEECRPLVLSYPDSAAAQSINQIARRFLYQDESGVPERKGIKGFLNRLGRLIK